VYQNKQSQNNDLVFVPSQVGSTTTTPFMISLSQLANYLRLKQDIALFIADPSNGFQESRRHLSEGLSRSLTMKQEFWSYSTQPGGYAFTNERQRFSVFVADDSARNTCFTSQELVAYLRANTTLHDINQMVVDMWLTHAAIRGEVVRGSHGWMLAKQEPQTN
jgi:hypothetical protein